MPISGILLNQSGQLCTMNVTHEKRRADSGLAAHTGWPCACERKKHACRNVGEHTPQNATHHVL